MEYRGVYRIKEKGSAPKGEGEGAGEDLFRGKEGKGTNARLPLAGEDWS